MAPVPTDECGDRTSHDGAVLEYRRDVAASNLLRLIGRRIEARASDYGVSISASPSTIIFASMLGSLGLPSAVTALGRAMGRHGIITAGHRDGSESMWGSGGGGRSLRMVSAGIVVVDAILMRWWEEDAERLFSGVETEKSRGGVQEACGARFFLIAFDWRWRQ